jgi:hypothetical protein
VNDDIIAGTSDQNKKQYAKGPQDLLQGDITVSFLLVWVSHATVTSIWTRNLYLKYELVPANKISTQVMPAELKKVAD